MTHIRVYDTPRRKKVEFESLEPGKVRMYSCGPTVWDYAHIGNFRAFLFPDVLKRYLQYRGFEVEHVMNLTDVDDRIVQQVNDRGSDIDSYVGTYIDGFFDDLDRLGIRRADRYPRATEHIPEMVEMIGRLVESGSAYERDGSVYFAIESFKPYGEFANLDMSGMRDGVRIDSDKYDKEHARDFVLWKAWTEADGAVSWEAPYGRGRPGWHLECSCMSMKYLGETFDIHTGGVDLIFPHHQNEIAQSEATTHRPFVRYWMHNEFVNIDGTAMSKSLGNNLRLQDIGDDELVRAYRYLVVTSHYRTVLNFTDEALAGARSARRRLNRACQRLSVVAADQTSGDSPISWEDRVASAEADFRQAMDDDLNTPRGMAAIFGLVGDAERALSSGDLLPAAAASALRFLKATDGVLGFLDEVAEPTPAAELAPAQQGLLEERLAAREAKDWARSDELRDQLASAGILVTDTPDGQQWSLM
ncbi:MAG: cysteine--tRNA ligase [Gemmatimonadetes bacterium]|jgi:cysteinyl-tRNA synthetase|nr:cysteine--tRNA ligase [Gemmatimonadota bacterium]MBT6147891.1 cysteine--tRNA ligase [Gemmatimonadota bacterium]MBT7863427.1 cysteine--tRNA ligase [Gemmatimonadota bacterium]